MRTIILLVFLSIYVNLSAQSVSKTLKSHAVQTVYTSGDYRQEGAEKLPSVVAIMVQPRGGLQRRASVAQTGALWGLAYYPLSRRLYRSAFAKRFAGFGPIGPGGIYVQDTDPTSMRPFVDLAKLGIPIAPPCPNGT